MQHAQPGVAAARAELQRQGRGVVGAKREAPGPLQLPQLPPAQRPRTRVLSMEVCAAAGELAEGYHRLLDAERRVDLAIAKQRGALEC